MGSAQLGISHVSDTERSCVVGRRSYTTRPVMSINLFLLLGRSRNLHICLLRYIHFTGSINALTRFDKCFRSSKVLRKTASDSRTAFEYEIWFECLNFRSESVCRCEK